MTRPRADVVIVAAGSGTRMGRPKQFLPLMGKGVCEWSLGAFAALPEIGRIALVLSKDDLGRHGPRLRSSRVAAVEGAATRLESLRRGLRALASRRSLVAVHDGARPLVSPAIIRRTLAAAARWGAAVAAVPAKDTLKTADRRGVWVADTPERSRFWQAQTPQAYRRAVLEGALRRFAAEKDASDESQLVARAGHAVRLVASDYENIKITTPADLAAAEAWLRGRGQCAPGTLTA